MASTSDCQQGGLMRALRLRTAKRGRRGLQAYVAGCLLATLLCPVRQADAEQTTLRIGHFPNITHTQALVAHGLSRAGRGWFEQRLGPDVRIEWFIYNAGPSAMEAIFADSID